MVLEIKQDIVILFISESQMKKKIANVCILDISKTVRFYVISQ